jgi:ribosomal protein S18 acetylase RimI-like enzyme
MLEIVLFQPGDMDVLIRFVSAIQEHERLYVPELKSGDEIGRDYAQLLLKKVSRQNGLILMAHKAKSIIGFISGWIGRDDDPLLQEKYSDHAYVSDIFVSEAHRGQGVAQELLKTLEEEMAKRGCKRIRVCSKASNAHAVGLYRNSDYQPYEIIFSKTIGGSR